MASMFHRPKTPKPAKPPLMPDEATLLKARKRSISMQQGRSGRQSTMLSDRDRLGA